MSNSRKLFVTAVLGLAAIGAAAVAGAQATPARDFIPLAPAMRAMTVSRAQAGPSAGPFMNLTLRGGAMVSPRGAGLAGLDVDIPSASLGNGFHGRVDADAIIKANFGGIDTIFPVTFDQIYYSPAGANGHNVYWGGGLGAVLNGPVRFDGKLILGTELAKRVGAELNVHFTSHDVLLTLLARIHL